MLMNRASGNELRYDLNSVVRESTVTRVSLTDRMFFGTEHFVLFLGTLLSSQSRIHHHTRYRICDCPQLEYSDA